MHRRPGREGGYATAEFALTLPAIVLILAFCLAVLGGAGLRLRAEDAARAAAREAAVGADHGRVVAVVVRLAPGASVELHRHEDYVTASVSVPVPLLAEWGGASVRASATALVEE